ncbi:hypothetical protein ES332_D04G021900v1 [Gossypium tomentosum]|uniref:Uncharacterized protein n=1 Tax=Gossypium tomentosum TaxID=34277 RepID=A0A5D2L8A5_GOSTO|nr:hypothetical protein ES332_D04G021900v1 [Gossypium tomentosum]
MRSPYSLGPPPNRRLVGSILSLKRGIEISHQFPILFFFFCPHPLPTFPNFFPSRFLLLLLLRKASLDRARLDNSRIGLNISWNQRFLYFLFKKGFWDFRSSKKVADAANGVVIAIEKKLPSILVDETSVQKIQCLTPNIGVVYSGMGPDFRVLVRKSRKQAKQYHRLYKDVKAIGFTQGDEIMESSPVSQTTDPRPTFSDNVPNLGNGGNVPAMNVNNKLPTL